MVFGYWFIHGSLDWLWEFAGLGAPAMALLGLGLAMAVARTSARRARTHARCWPAAARWR